MHNQSTMPAPVYRLSESAARNGVTLDMAERFIHDAYPVLRDQLLWPKGLCAPATIPLVLGVNHALEGEMGVTGMTKDLVPEVIGISPLHWLVWDKRMAFIQAAATLAHEMIHAALRKPEADAHDEEFARYARSLGLDGPATGTWAGPKFIDWYNANLASVAHTQSNSIEWLTQCIRDIWNARKPDRPSPLLGYDVTWQIGDEIGTAKVLAHDCQDAESMFAEVAQVVDVKPAHMANGESE